jgi:hypothetical protein
MQQKAADKFVGIERHGLDTITLTTVMVGEADPPVTHVEEPVVRDGDAMCIAADIVQDVGRAGQGCLGVDDPLFGIELSAQLCKALGDAPHWGALNSVRLNFCMEAELSDASGQYEQSIQLPWPIH